jgi:hypothetical protein
MNIEQKTNIQELDEKDYTNVYGGISSFAAFPGLGYKIEPENPTPPSIGLDSLHQQTTHTGIFGS